ncbi:dienelactone hydrolase family protein [Frankia sp. AgB1.9]|nr:dienelactone hydrolase family protein [Frankia sp. AgW1.1]MBL7550680.1 dienelactone hydrolase family protein [Frankia sp. AgB1.9]MBL7621661.1 dienelactone hydrolase family protein [Frankia sp. AgB1.8]
MVAALALAGSGPASGPAGLTVPLAALASPALASAAGDDLPAPDELGGHGVGYQTVTIVDEFRNRTLTTAVWYPSEARLPRPGGTAGGSVNPASYEIAPRVGIQSRVAVADAPVERGRFPLVVISHGSAGNRVQLASLAEVLASHGYVVAAPDHPGDTMADFAAGRDESQIGEASDRPLDVSAVIDWMLCPDREFGPVLNPDQVAVVGFSFGGLTALVSPVGFVHAPGDPRVRVVVAISPASEVLPAGVVARIRVPTLLIGGTVDPLTPIEHNADQTFGELTSAPDRLEVRVPQGTHNSFTDLCDQAYLAANGLVPQGIRVRLQLGALVTCLPPMVVAAQAQQIARWYTVAYLERYLRGDARYGRFLTPAASAALPVPVTVRTAP